MSDSCSVLVVEDEAMMRTALAEMLSLEGFDVRSAANGRDALGVLGRWRPDLILTDLHMPVMDGWAFRDELRRRADLANIPVVVLSAAPRHQVRIDGLDAAAFLAKPCDLDALVAAIRRAVGSVAAEPMEAFPRLPSDEDAAAGAMIESPVRGDPQH